MACPNFPSPLKEKHKIKTKLGRQEKTLEDFKYPWNIFAAADTSIPCIQVVVSVVNFVVSSMELQTKRRQENLMKSQKECLKLSLSFHGIQIVILFSWSFEKEKNEQKF